MKKPAGKAEIDVRIDAAFKKLQARDAFLLENRVGERCVAARFAFYLVPLFRGFDVDVEYNRQGINPNHAKGVDAGDLKDCRSALRAFRDGKPTVRVFPDIIVHHRGKKGYEHNLLVIEIKRSTNNETHACDIAKIDVMLTTYKYRFGLFLVMPSGKGAAQKDLVKTWWGPYGIA